MSWISSTGRVISVSVTFNRIYGTNLFGRGKVEKEIGLNHCFRRGVEESDILVLESGEIARWAAFNQRPTEYACNRLPVLNLIVNSTISTLKGMGKSKRVRTSSSKPYFVPAGSEPHTITRV